jgi:phosphopantothenoylcysteine decarboxylase/phosphopantothenate--cysteine ligase
MAVTPIIPVVSGRRILLGVTGSIAAYKAADLASKLTQAGAVVDVVLTESAERFVAPLTFSSLTGHRAFSESDLWGEDAHLLHIDLGTRADLVVIAPATANTIAKLAAGFSDTLLLLAVLASHAPLVLAPAMDAGMFEHPATQANLATLAERGAVILGPTEGRMASGMTGMGRLLEPEDLLGHLRRILGRQGALHGRRVVVTAGGTLEPIDPVRVIANRSSGRQGYALAQAALDRGAEVDLITGPTALKPPAGATVVPVETAAEMQDAVLSRLEQTDILFMAAAVADFRAEPAPHKIKRAEGERTLVLTPTDDILAAVAQRRKRGARPGIVVGFAAESQNLVANAGAKVEAKKLDLIVANDILAKDSGFAVETNRVTLIDAGGGVQELPLLTKFEVAEAVLERVERLL